MEFVWGGFGMGGKMVLKAPGGLGIGGRKEVGGLGTGGRLFVFELVFFSDAL